MKVNIFKLNGSLKTGPFLAFQLIGLREKLVYRIQTSQTAKQRRDINVTVKQSVI